jgi:hypothetical protein
LAAEKAAVARNKELEVARLRALQEKVQDTRSAEDELRARRYQVCVAVPAMCVCVCVCARARFCRRCAVCW